MRSFGIALLALIVTACGSEPEVEGYRLDPQWPGGPKGTPMGGVSGVAVNSQGQLIVFHRAGRSWSEGDMPAGVIEEDTILILDPDTAEVIDSFGAGLFVMPHGVAVDPFDDIWVTDIGTHQLHKLSADGRLLITVGEAGVKGDDQNHFGMPSDLAFLSSGEMVVADGYENARIANLFANGTYRDEWGDAGKGSGEFNLLQGITVGPDDRIYVADRKNSRVQLFNPSGNFLGIFPEQYVGQPYGVEVGPDGKLYVVDTRPSEIGTRMIKMDRSGEILDTFTIPEVALEEVFGHDVAVGPDGAVYIANLRTPAVLKIIP